MNYGKDCHLADRSSLTVHSKDDYISDALSTSLIKGSDAINLSTRAGMAIFPSQAAFQIAWKGSPADSCCRFKEAAKELNLRTWMIAPVTMFSAQNWIRYEENDIEDPILPGYLSVIGCLLPIIKDMYWQISSCSREITGIQRRMSSLESRVSILERQFKQAENELRIERSRKIQSVEPIELEEPILLAGDLEKMLLVGPCWGPSLSGSVIRSIIGE